MLHSALLCLSMVVSGEARGEPLLGQVVVAATVINRAEHNHTTICHEANKPYQFAPRKKFTRRAQAVALATLVFYTLLPGELRAVWFFRSGVGPTWGPYKMTIGNHKFYGKRNKD